MKERSLVTALSPGDSKVRAMIPSSEVEPAVRNDLLRLHVMLLRQFLPKFDGVVVGIEIALGEDCLHRRYRFWRGPEGVLVRSHFDAVHVALPLRLAQRLARCVPAKASYVFGHKLAEVAHAFGYLIFTMLLGMCHLPQQICGADTFVRVFEEDSIHSRSCSSTDSSTGEDARAYIIWQET